MDADAPCRKPASHSLPPPPPALFAVRSRSGRVADLGAGGAAFSGPPDTPPRLSLVTVPFLWEEKPGKPKAPAPTAAASTPDAANAGPDPEGGAGTGGERHQDNADHERPLPLKLPPRLQQVPPLPSFAAATDTPGSSPKTVLQGPYYYAGGGRSKPPRWARSGGGSALRRTPSTGMALFSRTWSKPKAAAPAPASSKDKNTGGGDHERDAAGPDAPWCSPGSSSSSSSSVSTCFGGDDHGVRGRPADGREASSEEDDGSPRSSVRFTRFTRNRSLPIMTKSNLWASIRRSVKQITPILHGARSSATTRYGH